MRRQRYLEKLICSWVLAPFVATGLYLVSVREYRAAALFSGTPAVVLIGSWWLAVRC